jgi:hypothetical protein
VFFAHAGIEGKDLREQASAFVRRAKEDPTYAYYAVTGFVRFEKERVERGEITAGTLTNFVKAVKLFCEQNDIMLNWKKISRKLPRVREYASDRAPTREEILRWMEYPDRRIKPIILLMVSSGIRLGAWDYLRWKDVEPIYAESAPTRRTVEGACGRKAHRVQGDRGGVHDVHNTGGLPVPQGVDGLPSGPGGEGDTRVLAHA